MKTAEVSAYKRSSSLGRGVEMIEVGSVDKFPKVIYKNGKIESETIAGAQFYSFHQTLGTSNQIIMTAYKSKIYPEILLIVWRDFPYQHQVELGGDVMSQEIKNGGIKYLLVDNTYVQSGWMNASIENYLNTVWYPSLIELGLKGFAHIQALSSLGGASFNKFKEFVQTYLDSIASKLGRKVFTYLPIEVKEANVFKRSEALSEGLEKLINL